MIHELESIEAGMIYWSVGGHEETKIHGSKRGAARQLQHDMRNGVTCRSLADSSIPFFKCVVAFPNISRTEWVKGI